MPDHPPIQTVDDNDRPIGLASMDELHRQGLKHRIVVVILKDPDGNILLQHRNDKVSTNQNIWDASAAGHVDAGEDYLTAAKRELEEELGISNVNLTEVAYYYSEDEHDWRKLNRFRKVYVGQVPSDVQINFNKEEVDKVQWFEPAEIDGLVADTPDEIVADFVELLNRVEDENNQHQTTGQTG